MASLFAGEPLQAPSYATTTTDVPKWLQDYTVDLFSQQRAVSGTPFQPYALPRIADVTAPTTAAQNLITSSSGAYQPTVQNAISGTQGLAGATSVGNINAYMNPYTQNVTDQIAKLGARNLSENLLPQVSDQFIRAGQFGSSGMGTFGNRALRDTQEAILANQTSALNTGYTQALGASQADLSRQQGALAQTADLAKIQQGLTTADAAALESVGASQQAQQQKGLDVAYQDFLRQQGYPQEQINNMSATLRGLPATATPTTKSAAETSTTFTPSPLSQIASAFSAYKGLTSAKGGLIDGYAEGGAVTGGNDLHASVMADYGRYFKRGGAVPGYAQKGYVDVSNPAPMAPNYTAMPVEPETGGGYVPEDVAAPAVAAPKADVTGINPELAAMLKQYDTGIDYSKDIAANAAARRQQEAKFNQSISALKQTAPDVPSESEKWFKLAAAFSNPGKTGSFQEGMGNAAAVLSEYGAEKRKGLSAQRKLNTELDLKQQQYALENLRDEATQLRTLQGDASKDKREMIKAAIKDYVDSGKPQSEAGKIALDEGFKRGTDEYEARVTAITKQKLDNQLGMLNATLGNLALSQQKVASEQLKLEPDERASIREDENAIYASKSVLSNLDRAIQLNETAFANTPSDRALYNKLKVTKPDDARVKATEELENLIGTNVVGSLKSSYGGNPTEGERNALKELGGLGSANKQVRKAIFTRSAQAIKEASEFRQMRIQKIETGGYRKKPADAGKKE
jgi:hypothetical protein